MIPKARRPGGLEPATSWFVAVNCFIQPAQLTTQRTPNPARHLDPRRTSDLVETASQPAGAHGVFDRTPGSLPSCKRVTGAQTAGRVPDKNPTFDEQLDLMLFVTAAHFDGACLADARALDIARAAPRHTLTANADLRPQVAPALQSRASRFCRQGPKTRQGAYARYRRCAKRMYNLTHNLVPLTTVGVSARANRERAQP